MSGVNARAEAAEAVLCVVAGNVTDGAALAQLSCTSVRVRANAGEKRWRAVCAAAGVRSAPNASWRDAFAAARAGWAGLRIDALPSASEDPFELAAGEAHVLLPHHAVIPHEHMRTFNNKLPALEEGASEDKSLLAGVLTVFGTRLLVVGPPDLADRLDDGEALIMEQDYKLQSCFEMDHKNIYCTPDGYFPAYLSTEGALGYAALLVPWSLAIKWWLDEECPLESVPTKVEAGLLGTRRVFWSDRSGLSMLHLGEPIEGGGVVDRSAMFASDEPLMLGSVLLDYNPSSDGAESD